MDGVDREHQSYTTQEEPDSHKIRKTLSSDPGGTIEVGIEELDRERCLEALQCFADKSLGRKAYAERFERVGKKLFAKGLFLSPRNGDNGFIGRVNISEEISLSQLPTKKLGEARLIYMSAVMYKQADHIEIITQRGTSIEELDVVEDAVFVSLPTPLMPGRFYDGIEVPEELYVIDSESFKATSPKADIILGARTEGATYETEKLALEIGGEIHLLYAYENGETQRLEMGQIQEIIKSIAEYKYELGGGGKIEEETSASMKAFFSTFSAGEADDDGDISTEVELNVTNNTAQAIYRINYKIWFLADESTCFEETDSYEDVYLAPGDSTSISPWGRINERDIQESTISVKANGDLCRRDFVVLGKIAVPGPGESVRCQKQVDFDWYTGPLTVVFSRTNPDSDGDFSIDFRCLIPNQSSKHLKAVEIKAQLLDSEGVEIDTSDCQEEIPVKSAKLINSSFWRPKARQLEGASAVLSLKALIPIETFEASETTEIGD